MIECTKHTGMIVVYDYPYNECPVCRAAHELHLTIKEADKLKVKLEYLASNMEDCDDINNINTCLGHLDDIKAVIEENEDMLKT